MNKENNLKNRREINYNVLKQLELHSKKYNQTSDKKIFLKNICAYEQKIILLNSQRPYEVLNYLDEIDLKSSRLVLSELTYDEIKDLLDLFSSEDKNRFYTTFSDLELVNMFIMHDKNSSEYIKDLSFERKVELINSTKKETIESSSKIYESMPYNERVAVSESITDVDAKDALTSISLYKEDVQQEQINEKTTTDEKSVLDDKKEENQEKVEEEQPKVDNKENVNVEEIIKDKNEFFKVNFNLYLEKYPELKNIDLSTENLYSLLSPELQQTIDSDFAMQNQVKLESEKTIEIYEKYSIIGDGESQINIIDNPDIVAMFDKAKRECEQVEIYNIMHAKKTELLEDQIKTK